MKPVCLILPFLLMASGLLSGQPFGNDQIQKWVAQYKNDPRGPYKEIRWYCKDGSIIPPKDTCPQPGGGVQRASYKNEVVTLAERNHIFLGQILSTTPRQDFWDEGNYFSRLKQYQLEKYLRAVDDGWVLRKGQYYRGAMQTEDETAWGKDFLIWLLRNDEALSGQFYLVRQAVRDLPHGIDDSRTLAIRALSKTIAEKYTAFEPLRVKIHGQPEAKDLNAVVAFRESHKAKLSAALSPSFDRLEGEMRAYYQPPNLAALNPMIGQLPPTATIRQHLEAFVSTFSSQSASPAALRETALLLEAIREQIRSIPGGEARLALMDISVALEDLYFREAPGWQAQTPQELMDKICHSATAAVGTGLVEMWEWAALYGELDAPAKPEISLGRLNRYVDRSRSFVEWGAGTVRGAYQDVVALFGGFEPMAYGFYDDKIRSSVLLDLGMAIGRLSDFLAVQANLSNRIMDLSNASTARGLNSGIALGELVVVADAGEDMETQSNKIYVFMRPPSDLKPVAGIATATEGNMVSHVQLLARNLGIPNAVLSPQNLEDLRRYAGQEVFYAVSPKGTVIMKPAAEMTPQERELFAVQARDENKISVPVEKIVLSENKVLDMRTVDATASGKLCGPKAANLGQLKKMFPDQVVEGLVIPFGIFRDHMEQPMPGRNTSYWNFLMDVFRQAETRRRSGTAEAAIEAYVLGELAVLREAIGQMPLLPAFEQDLRQQFEQVLGKKMGEIPVFLRSDTNMEDLENFTGAGLNLTLFNVVDAEKIIKGIKDVWASPYTERSFRWRQSYLLNPENVYPSILVIPSVDVEYSGVMITTGIASNDKRDLTVAFSRGAGGAVDGQAAESWLLAHYNNRNDLLSPAREPFYRRLPAAGGTSRLATGFAQSILNLRNVNELRALALEINEKLPQAPGIETSGPFDVELGFLDDRIWLFQVRPFVENQNAASAAYLSSISPEIPLSKQVNLVAPF